MKNKNDSTPPAIHRITSDLAPQFPCWVFDCAKGDTRRQFWWYCENASSWFREADSDDTHWCQSPTRPTVATDATTPPAPTPTLPSELCNELAAFLTADDAKIVAEIIARHWPRPAPVTADARELWTQAHLAYVEAHRGGNPLPVCFERAAAVLAPVVQRLREAEGLVSSISASQSGWIAKCAEEVARAEAAEAKLAEAVREAQGRGNALYRAVVTRLAPHLPRDTRDLEWDVLPSTVGFIAAERDNLRAEVERLKSKTS